MRTQHRAPLFRWEYFMKFRLSSLALLLALVTVPALAHGNKVHVRGTIEKISAESVLVKTPDGKSVEVKLVASTVYVSHSASKAAQSTDLNVDKPPNLTELPFRNCAPIHP